MKLLLARYFLYGDVWIAVLLVCVLVWHVLQTGQKAQDVASQQGLAILVVKDKQTGVDVSILWTTIFQEGNLVHVTATLIGLDAPSEVFSPFPAESKHTVGLRKEKWLSQKT